MKKPEVVPPFFMDWPDLVNAAGTEPHTATLIDGRQVDSTGEEWRAECEARRVLALPNVTARREYLRRVEKRRGEASRAALEALVMAVFEARRASRAIS